MPPDAVSGARVCAMLLTDGWRDRQGLVVKSLSQLLSLHSCQLVLVPCCT